MGEQNMKILKLLCLSLPTLLIFSGCASNVETPDFDESPPEISIFISWGPRVSEGEVIDPESGSITIESGSYAGNGARIPRRANYNVIVAAHDGGGVQRFSVGQGDTSTFRNNNEAYEEEWGGDNQKNSRYFIDTLIPDRGANYFWLHVNASDYGDIEGPEGNNSNQLDVRFRMGE